MKKILISVSIIAAIAAIVSGVTYAYFTASGRVDNNTISAAVLKLTVNKGAGKEISLSNIMPGYADDTYRWFDAYNNGDVPLEYFMKFEKTAGDEALFNALNIELRDGGYEGKCDGPQIYSGALKDFAANTKISQFNVHATNSSIDIENDNIRAGWTMRVCQKISFPDNGNQNDLQGKSVTFSEIINATQDASSDINLNTP